MAADGQSTEHIMAQRSLSRALAYHEHIDGDEAAAENAREMCEAAWDAGWYSHVARMDANPFRGLTGAPRQ